MAIVLILFFILGMVTLHYAISSYMNHSDTMITKPSTVTHDRLLEMVESAGGPRLEGICFGFTMNWAQGVVERKDGLFYQKVALLRKHQDNVLPTIERVEYRKAQNIMLTEEEQVIDTLRDFMLRICIAQDPTDYKSVFGTLLRQPDITEIFQCLTSHRNPPQHIYYQTVTFASRQEAESYFNLLKKTKINPFTPIIISSSTHSMGLLHTGKIWLFLDINNLYAQNSQFPYREFNSHQLVEELYRVTCEAYSRRLVICLDFIAVRTDPLLIEKIRRIYTAFPLTAHATKKTKSDYFGLAACQGDLRAVRQCLNLNWSAFSNEMKSESPIQIAISQNRHDVVRAMLPSIQHRINYRRRKDGFSLLHLACYYGATEVIAELLEIQGILVDLKNKNGETALMLACQSQYYKDESLPFQLLLDKGALLTPEDHKGQTAMNHARASGNSIARQIMEERSRKDVPLSHSRTNRLMTGISFFSQSILHTAEVVAHQSKP